MLYDLSRTKNKQFEEMVGEMYFPLVQDEKDSASPILYFLVRQDAQTSMIFASSVSSKWI